MASSAVSDDYSPSHEEQSDEGLSSFFSMIRVIEMPNDHIIDKNGDVILVLEDATARVSSEVLSASSPVFKALLGPNFSEGQQLRSAAHPKRIELQENDAVSVARICFMLHKSFDEVRTHICSNETTGQVVFNVVQMAIVADKYGVVDRLKNEMAPALLEPFAARSGRVGLTIQNICDLAVAAYLFEQHGLFTLFTRCLIVDWQHLLSEMSKLRLFTYVPVIALLALEEQRTITRWRMDKVIKDLAMIACLYCDQKRYDHKFPDATANNLSPREAYWPPDVGQHSIRETIEALYYIGNYHAFGGSAKALCGKHKYPSIFSHLEFEESASALNAAVAGLCFTCTKGGKQPTECEHKDRLRARMGELDPVCVRPG